MRSNLLFLSITALLLFGGVWGIVQIKQSTNTDTAQATLSAGNSIYRTKPKTEHAPSGTKSIAVAINNDNSQPVLREPLNMGEPSNNHAEEIKTLLKSDRADLAARYIESNYSSLSSADLEELKQLFWNRARELQLSKHKEKLKLLYLSAAKVFNDAAFWQAGSAVAADLKEWPLALTSMRRAALLESQPDRLEENLFSLVKISSYLRAEQATTGDELSIQRIYQDLVREHPSYGRFQLELAQSFLRAGNTKLARPLLAQLIFDPEFSAIAKMKLDKLKQDSDGERIAVLENSASQRADQRPTDIIVPLQRRGNSFLVSGSAQGQRLTMLLDTGASITALSKDLIARLNLTPTGQEIQLSTANGLTRSRLFKLDKLRLGKIYVENVVVAEIDLAGAKNFKALLGTDLLNTADARYSYLIDNTKNALIFRRK